MSSIHNGLAGFGGRMGRAALVALLALGGLRLAAQEPMDGPDWQQRCSALDASMMAIDKGAAPPALLATTAGIAGEKFAAIARERSGAGQHWVACSMFFTAAMAERQGNGGKVNTARAHGDVVLGFAEMKLGQGKSLGLAEKMMRAEESVMAFKDPAITPADLAAVVGAFGLPMGGPPMGPPGMVVAGGPPPPDGAGGFAPPGGVPPGGVPAYVPPPGAPAAGFAAPAGGVPAYAPPAGAPGAFPAAAVAPAPGAPATAAGTTPHVHRAGTAHPAHKPTATPPAGTAPATTAAATPHA